MKESFRIETIKEDIAEKIKVGQIIPVIGDNIFFIHDDQGKKIELQRYVVEQLIKLLEDKSEGYNRKDYFLKGRACIGFKGMSILNRAFKEVGGNLSTAVYKIYKEHRILERSFMDPNVEEFLQLGKFPLIITTSYTDIVEHHIGKGYRKVYYMKEKKEAQDIGKTDCTPFENLVEPTVFHILGSNSSGLRCAYTESDFLQYLHSLHDTNCRPSNLMQYLNKRYILTLGCSIPDWTLRFLLYSFKNDLNDTYESNNNFNGGVVDSYRDDELAEFLYGIDYFYESIDSKESFIMDLNKIIRVSVESNIEKPRVFISVYTSEDMIDPLWRGLIMDKIVTPLKEKYDIWLCEEQLEGYAGEAYWSKIRDGLKSCEYFLPVLTPNLLNYLEKNLPMIESIIPRPEQEQGIITEWKYAKQMWEDEYHQKQGYCIPFMLGTTFSRVKEVFFSKEESYGGKYLRELIFGEINGADAAGNQIVNDVLKIQL